MPTLRHVCRSSLLLALLSLPACAIPLGAGHPARETSWPTLAETPSPAPVPFAIARRPGTLVRLNPATSELSSAKIVPEPSETVAPAPLKEAGPTDLPPVVVPPPQETPLVAIVRAYAEGRPEAAVPFVQMLEKPNRDMVLQLVPALVKVGKLDPAQADPKELAATVEPLVAVANLLNKRAPMTIQKAVFCRSIENFGRYESLPEGAALKPHTTNCVYFEIGNVASEPANPNGADGYLTKLVCSWQVRDSGDKALDVVTRTGEVTKEPIVTKIDLSQSPLRDYFFQLVFTTPTKPGRYTVHFKVKDVATGREAVRALPFRVP